VKDKVSELMDGELDNQGAKKIFAVLKQDETLYRNWEIYHLIGDTIRKSPNLTTNVTERVSERLSSEPTLLAPVFTSKQSNQTHSSSSSFNTNKTGNSKIKVFAFATAASLVAMISTWLVMQNVYQQSHPAMVAETSKMQVESDKLPVPVQVIHSPVGNQYPYFPAEDMTTYLYFHNFHKELSPGPAINRKPAYIYPATDFQDNYGR